MFSLFYEYVPLEYIRVPVIDRVHQAEYVIRIICSRRSRRRRGLRRIRLYKKINRSHTHTPTENNTPDTDTHAHDKNNTP